MQHTDATLDRLRSVGDPLADSVIEALVSSSSMDEANHLLREFDYNNEAIPAELPDVVLAYLRITDNPPAWTDPERIKRAHSFFLDDGAYVAAVLCLGGMVGSYSIAHGAKLLSMTRRLEYPQRRLLETGQFCFYMMDEHAFDEARRFLPAVQKVRLIHAAIRHHVANSGQWPEEYGVPINQEDMLGALMVFSTSVVQAMRKLGIHVTDEESEDYYYTWRVTGVMLGIQEQIIPAALEESYELTELLRKRHVASSEEGIRLTQSLIKMYQDTIPGKLVDGAVPAALIRFVVGDDIADVVEVPRSGWDRVMSWLPRAMDVAEDVEDESVLMRKVLDRACWIMLNGGIRKFSGGTSFHYDIPEDLRSAWGVREERV